MIFPLKKGFLSSKVTRMTVWGHIKNIKMTGMTVGVRIKHIKVTVRMIEIAHFQHNM